MLSLFVAIGLVEAVGSNCPPLPTSETFWYVYYEFIGSRDTLGPTATKDSSGNYPPGTHAIRYCKALSKRDAPGEFFAICYKRMKVYGSIILE